MPEASLSLILLTFSAAEPEDWERLTVAATTADEIGVDRLALPDHVVFGEHLDAYGDPSAGGTAGGRQPTGPDGHWLEPLTTLTFLAARTTRVRFMTNILLAALRRPAVLAKTTATIDVLSGGRLDLGVGVGWQREEYEACGLDYADRGAQLDHTLSVLQTLWSDDVAAFSDDRLAFSRIHQQPKPVQRGGVPIWVSGTVNPRAMRRLARFGSGWIPWGADAADLVEAIPRMRTAVRDAGGDADELEVLGSLPVVTDDDGAVDVDATVAPVGAQVEAGVTDFRLGWRGDAGNERDVATLAAIVEAFRRAR